MRVLNTELRLRFKNRKPRPFNRAASADDAATEAETAADEQRLNGNMRMYIGR
ncbi:hypothetical protein KR215_010303 [Drosophila sulfurigaster]|nr:hypothetical protein KR215_010303 [Drosophila sulfurigaster]